MKYRLLFITLGAALVFWFTSQALQEHPRSASQAEVLRVRLPAAVQLAYAGGDPWLAANLNVFRSLIVAPTITERETYRVQAQLQLDASLFNPRHEDNYYVAAAILPWNGFVNEAQAVLKRASQYRTRDWMPPFYYAFGLWYFEQRPMEAGRWADIAASRSNATNARALGAIAAKWYEQGDQPQLAHDLIQAMQQQTQDQRLRQQLQWRIDRLEGLIHLRAAHQAWQQQHKNPPPSLQALVGYADLLQIPNDPTGLGYGLDSQGRPILRRRPNNSHEPH